MPVQVFNEDNKLYCIGIENSSLHFMFYELQHAEEELISILFLTPPEVLEVITIPKSEGIWV